MNLKYMHLKNSFLALVCFMIYGGTLAQADVAVLDSTSARKMLKLDGIASVVGDYVILDSDIEKTLIDLKSQGASTEDINHCQLLGKLMEDRLYAHQAVQDSLLVSDEQVNSTSDRQIQQLIAQIGSAEKMLKYYKKPDLESFKAELYEINKLRMLSEKFRCRTGNFANSETTGAFRRRKTKGN